MSERRGNPRYRCRTRCKLRVGRRTVDAVLLDVSRSGLSIHSTTELAQGEPVELVVASGLRIQAIAWRTGRTRAGHVVGMMLSEVSPEYEALLTGLEKREPARASAPQPRSNEKPPPQSVDPWWRLRVKECEGSRTRVVTLAAPTRAVATERALREIGSGWEVLEVRPTAPLERKPS